MVTRGASAPGAVTARGLLMQGAPVAILHLNAERGETVAAGVGGTSCQVNVADGTTRRFDMLSPRRRQRGCLPPSVSEHPRTMPRWLGISSTMTC